MGALGFSFRSLIVRKQTVSFFFQSIQNINLFVLKIVVHIPPFLFIFWLNDQIDRLLTFVQ